MGTNIINPKIPDTLRKLRLDRSSTISTPHYKPFSCEYIYLMEVLAFLAHQNIARFEQMLSIPKLRAPSMKEDWETLYIFSVERLQLTTQYVIPGQIHPFIMRIGHHKFTCKFGDRKIVKTNKLIYIPHITQLNQMLIKHISIIIQRRITPSSNLPFEHPLFR